MVSPGNPPGDTVSQPDHQVRTEERLAGRNRTCVLRVPNAAICQAELQPVALRRDGGVRTRDLRSPRPARSQPRSVPILPTLRTPAGSRTPISGSVDLRLVRWTMEAERGARLLRVINPSSRDHPPRRITLATPRSMITG